MAFSSSPAPDESEAPEHLAGAWLGLLEDIQEPAVIYLPGGRIVAVNRAAARLSDLPGVGRTIGELIEHYDARTAYGGPLIPGDLPSTRALRGEIVTQGERIDTTLPDGSAYRALVTSTPIIVDGKVVAALSIWHDFDKYVRRLAGRQAPPETKDSIEGRRRNGPGEDVA